MVTRTSPGGTIPIAGKTVSRLGLGTLRLTGPGCWGPPVKRAAAVRVLRDAIDIHGITHIDTADAYGPATAEELIRNVLHPYPPDVLIATKVGMIRPAPNQWRPLGRPDYLRAAVEASLRRLGTDTLHLCYLHRVDPNIPFGDQVGTLADLRAEGKIAAIGLSKVTPEQIAEAATITSIAAVQNCFNIDEPADAALDYCADHGIPFVAYRPLDAGRIAADKALPWLLGLGKHVAAIPGTATPEHLADLVTAISKTGAEV